jgi:ketosteroid isomerase-like protein
MGMRSGKVLKSIGKTARRTKSARPKAAKSAKRAAQPRVITKTVEVDRNRALRDVAQRIVDLTIANDDEATLALYADNVESQEANNPPSVGIDAIKEKFAMWRGMVSDAAFTPRSVTVDGKTIVIEWEGRVTLASSGRVAEMNEVAVHEIADGKIVRERYYYDPSVLQA